MADGSAAAGGIVAEHSAIGHAAQVRPLSRAGETIRVERLFTDKASGKDTQRSELEALLAFVRDGDTVVVHSMDRLARNLDDLRPNYFAPKPSERGRNYASLSR